MSELTYADHLVSVMVPAFNAEATIIETLESVWRQSHRPIELIVVDDGSTDSTAERIQKWVSALDFDSGFQVHIERQENQGLLRTRSRGLMLSRGTFLQFLDADDVLHSSKIEKCLQIFTGGDYEVVVPRTRKFTSYAMIATCVSEPPTFERWPRPFLGRATITGTKWYSVGPLFRREIVEAVGDFPPDVHPVAEELEFHGRIKLTTRKIKYVDEVLNFYRIGNKTSITGSLERLYDGRIAGTQTAMKLLQRFAPVPQSEWLSLLTRSFRTYYQTVCCVEDEDLHARARLGFIEVAQSYCSVFKVLNLVPRQLVEVPMEMIWRCRSRNRRSSNLTPAVPNQ